MKKDLKLRQIGVKRVTFARSHSAFTDLVSFKNQLLLCYRRATDHVSSDGIIMIHRLDKHGKTLAVQRLSINGADLRDPKLIITPDNYLCLLAYARYRNEDNVTTHTDNLTWRSQDGHSWSSPNHLGHNLWWLWRIVWRKDAAYGLAYRRSKERVDLLSGNPHRSMHVAHSGVLSKERHHLGYPNESAIHQTENGDLIALVRRDADSFTAQLGSAKPPYSNWLWHDLNEYIGGPTWLSLGENQFLVAGRGWTGKQLITRLWQLCIETGSLSILDDLPSGGDNSYPGIVVDKGHLYISYYSSHLDNVSEIYLARYWLEPSASM
jgi:hypothetical protein